METTRIRLAEGIYLTYLPADQFKTGLLSAQFVTPLTREAAAANALLPAILRRGTARFPDMGTLSAKLDRLYGASIDYTVRKKGENQCVGFVAGMIDDRFAPGGEHLLEEIAALLGELICAPVLENGRFLADYVTCEQNNLIDAIRSIMNDKRDWADARLLHTMCAGEPYGLPRLGREADVAALDADKLMARYRALLSTAQLELFYCGRAQLERVQQALLAAFTGLPERHVEPLGFGVPHSGRTEVQYLEEEMDVTQGKLGMGFSCGSADVPAVLLGNTLFGGSSNSKLFLNVREKLSLCYYASSVYHRQKQIITVSSGIEFENYQKACDEILAQLAAVQRGELEDWELEGARSTLRNAYQTIGDSQGRLENFYLGQIATGYQETPEEFLKKVEETSLERIMAAMSTVKLDTVYFLKGEANAE